MRYRDSALGGFRGMRILVLDTVLDLRPEMAAAL
jgi:hypothetical protein